MDRVEVLHVADIDINPADVVRGSAGGLDRAFQVFAHLSRLRADITHTRDAAINAPCRHSGDEQQPSRRLNRSGVREDTARLTQLWTCDLGLGHLSLLR